MVNQVPFDDDLLLAQAEEDMNLFLLNNPCPLMIDEVQKCPSVFSKLKIVLDNTDSYGTFYLTGSQKLQLMEDISESLAGRVSVAELEGLSLCEIYDVPFEKHFVPTQEYIKEREGAMFETFVINEIFKSYSNEGLEYDFNVFYYNRKDKKKKKNGEEVEVDGEIDLILQEDGVLYPIEIKMSASPKADMASEFDILDGVPDKKKGMGTIICLYDKKMYLRENLVALPLEYI